MSNSKAGNQLASQLPKLAKYYFAHLGGAPAAVSKQEKSLLDHLNKLHKQLRVKGTSLIRASSQNKSFDGENDCPPGGEKCDDGTCAPPGCCGEEEGLIATPAAKAKPAAKKPAAKKKK